MEANDFETRTTSNARAAAIQAERFSRDAEVQAYRHQPLADVVDS